MENNERSLSGWGPRRTKSGFPLSVARAAVLDRLRDQPQPLTLVSLMAATGLHENTLREHLSELGRRGLVRRHRAEPSGRGRPAWLYQLTVEQPVRSDYAGLAAALASVIARTSDDPGGAGAEAGEEWGRELARDRGAVPVSPATARHQVFRLLDDAGFDPHSEPGQPAEIRLTRCPLLEAAYRHREVVCAVHLGIVRGALSEYGADPSGSTLVPFAEPGACLLAIPPFDEDSS